MEENQIENLYAILDRMEEQGKSSKKIQEIKDLIADEQFVEALEKINTLEDVDDEEEEKESFVVKKDGENEIIRTIYPKRLQNNELEEVYIGLLLENPKLITKYYILYQDCFFENEELLNIYKNIRLWQKCYFLLELFHLN